MVSRGGCAWPVPAQRGSWQCSKRAGRSHFFFLKVEVPFDPLRAGIENDVQALLSGAKGEWKTKRPAA